MSNFIEETCWVELWRKEGQVKFASHTILAGQSKRKRAILRRTGWQCGPGREVRIYRPGHGSNYVLAF